MNSECCCNETGIKSDVKSECDAVLRIVGMEDARARDVFKIRPFVGSIPYHGLCHTSAVYSLLVFVVDRQNKNSPKVIMGKSQVCHYYRFSEIFTWPNTSVTILAPNHHYMISAMQGKSEITQGTLSGASSLY